MTINAELLIAITGLIAGCFAAYRSLLTDQSTAKKDEMELLRGEIERLSNRVAAQDQEIAKLRAENAMLYADINNLRGENSKLQRELGAITAERGKLQARVTELERMVNPAPDAQ